MAVLAWILVSSLGQDPFLTSFEEGLAKAKKENKPLFIDFGHPW